MNTLRTTWATRSGKLILLFLAATLLCCAPITIATLLSPTPTPTDTPTYTPTDTPTYTPTDLPTDTPTYTPTDTPTYTPTPRPTDTPTTAQLTPDERAYAVAVGTIGFDAADGLTNLGKLLLDPNIGNEDWTLKFASQVVRIQLDMQKIRDLQPPPRFAETHRGLLDGADDCDAAMTALVNGIDAIDGQSLTKSASLTRSCNEHLMTAADRILELMK